MKKIIVTGANGKMGQEVIKMISQKEDFELVGAVDISGVGEDIHKSLALKEDPVVIKDSLEEVLEEKDADLLVDFTTAKVVMDNIRTALGKGINIVVGATGITEADLTKIEDLNKEAKAKIIVAPNFAIGAILMMEFSKRAAKFMERVEIIELHHDNKLDAPSGTAIKTAELINENLGEKLEDLEVIEKVKGARGANIDGINLHSIRLPGLVAHQEVLFGGLGQTLSIKHDSINRESFMPGVELAIRKLDEIEGLVYGLDNLIEF